MEIHNEQQNACGCRPMSHPKSTGRDVINRTPGESTGEPKYFQEIGAEMIGNQLIIRIEKDKNKSTKRHAEKWDPPCDCEIPEIRMASSTEGPRIVNAGDNNQIVFRIRSRTLVGKDETNYKPEAFAYQLESGKKGKDSNDQHRSITVHSQLGEPTGSQQVHSDHITDGNQNIYLLRIKKNSPSPRQKKRNIELELRTPKPPTPHPGTPDVPQLARKYETLNPPDIPEPQIKVAETIETVKQAGKKAKKNKKK